MCFIHSCAFLSHVLWSALGRPGFVTETKRKTEHRGPSDVQTYNLAILKMSELNANVSHCNLPRSRLGEPFVFRRDYHEENGPIEKKGRDLPLPGPWESWERK